MNNSVLTEKEVLWAERYLRIAREVASWSSCLSRQVGCVITVNRRLVSTGYNGAPAGIPSCRERGVCLRKDSKSGENLDQCYAAHAEQNAITWAAKEGGSLKGGDVYVTTLPCTTCMKLIIQSGLKRVFYLEDYNSPFTYKLAEEAGIKLYKIDLN